MTVIASLLNVLTCLYHIEMLESLTPAELDNADLINGVARERIARQSNKSVDDVSKMVFFFRQSRVMATWLHMK